jgi:hypothetical protein
MRGVRDGVATEGGRSTMTEASAGGGRAVVERRLLQRSLEDESFRQRLLEDPRAAVEEELGTRLPEEIQVRAVEESAETIYLVLPPATFSAGQQEAGENSDRELEAVAGGGIADWGGPDPMTQHRTCMSGPPTIICC